ncbi:BRO-N domain-containing protein [Fischerella sp. PCC 9605]|uniref:BRO-N domain-containing protein n=1 Tax=Fischerella sp. PCC 9605 TaxID=1173024 RepID=UPI00047EF1E7|nr:BRO family protein [Fischerella sp. PCC 9605]
MIDAIIEEFKQAGARFFLTPTNDFEVVAIDLAEILGYSNPEEILNIVSPENIRVRECRVSISGSGRGLRKTRSYIRKQSLTFVTEPGFYEILLRVQHPKAKAFQKWVFEDVLPSIRKTGSYEEKHLTALERAERYLEYLMAMDENRRRLEALLVQPDAITVDY